MIKEQQDQRHLHVPASSSVAKREIPMKMPQAKKQKTVAQALGDDPEPEETEEEKMESKDPAYKEESSEESAPASLPNW